MQLLKISKERTLKALSHWSATSVTSLQRSLVQVKFKSPALINLFRRDMTWNDHVILEAGDLV